MKKIIFCFLFLNSFLFEKNLLATSDLILKSIKKSDCDTLNVLVDANYKITKNEKNQYLNLSQEQIDKNLKKTNLIFDEYFRIIKTMILFSAASMSVGSLREKFTKRDDNYLYNASLLFMSFTIICSGVNNFFKILDRFDLKNKRTRALAVQTIIEKFNVI